MNFDFAAAIAARPGGDTRAQLVDAYGDPLAGSRPDPRTRGWFIPNPQWEAEHLTSINTDDLPGFPPFGERHVTKIKLHRRVAPVFRATWDELVRRGLHDKLRTFSGSFAPRHMGHDPQRAVSVHAYGAAIDFDAAWNGYGVPLERAQINREVVRCFEECGWSWGGRWTDPYEDAMHFQLTDVLRGVQAPEWQDAMARPRPPAPPALPPQRQPGGGPDGNWYPVHTPNMQVIPGAWASVVQSERTGELRLVRVPDDKLRAAGLL